MTEPQLHELAQVLLRTADAVAAQKAETLQ